MSIEFITAQDGFLNYAIGTDLTQWDNAQAALVVGEINAMDWLINASIKHTKPKTIKSNPMSSGRYSRRFTSGRYLGNIVTNHFLQTGILTYAMFGGSTAVAGGVERDITVDTNELPIWLGFYAKKKGTTASRLKDCLGVVPMSLDISCSENQPIARQSYNGAFVFSGAGGDLAEQTKLVQASYLPYTWYNYKNVLGASSFLYNTGAINVEIVGFNLHYEWTDKLIGTYDANGYPTNGLISPPFLSKITLDCKRKDAAGTDIEAISDLDHASYAGDLDLIVDFYQSATRYLKYTHDDMYVIPESFEERLVSDNSWFDGVSFDLEFRNETSSVAVKTIDALADTYYTNP